MKAVYWGAVLLVGLSLTRQVSVSYPVGYPVVSCRWCRVRGQWFELSMHGGGFFGSRREQRV